MPNPVDAPPDKYSFTLGHGDRVSCKSLVCLALIKAGQNRLRSNYMAVYLKLAKNSERTAGKLLASVSLEMRTRGAAEGTLSPHL